MSTEYTTDYFSRARHDVAQLVPADSRSILEVGAGFGALGRILAQRDSVVLDAVELNPAAAPHLSGVYRRQWMGDIESLELDGALHQYDCLILADVLEHLVDPWSVLSRLCHRLRPGGHVVTSLPNVRNIALLYRLIVQGRWDYEDSGILDRTHLRFFTRHSITALVEGAGLSIERWEMNRDSYRGARKAVASIAKLFNPEFDVCQYLVLARKP
jgi:2-polyprenyl-3-methyl-5-hydroxy-6-metoxy-1,4-benzoquinol methylase